VVLFPRQIGGLFTHAFVSYLLLIIHVVFSARLLFLFENENEKNDWPEYSKDENEGHVAEISFERALPHSQSCPHKTDKQIEQEDSH